ncbi:MAG: DinB family protein [Isosphaeraceae bacterium]
MKGIEADRAAAKHPKLVHSIWGLVSHLAAWVEVVTIRIDEWRPLVEPDDGDFPPVTDLSPAAWAAALERLHRSHHALLDVIARLDPGKLDRIVPGKDYPGAVMLHGTAQHYGYHAGQIALLKKLLS